MATIKTVLRPYKNNEGKQQITIRVSHKGVNVYDISKLLGHSSISITEQYLRSIDPETFDEALALVYD